MADLAAISRRVSLAIANADAYCATIAGEVLRHEVTQLLRLARSPDCCRDCEFKPHDLPIKSDHQA